MSKTNTLTSHYSERRNRRIDKMSSSIEGLRGKSKKFEKRFSKKKMRQLLKQNKEDKI